MCTPYLREYNFTTTVEIGNLFPTYSPFLDLGEVFEMDAYLYNF
jgi:hypothetical protein